MKNEEITKFKKIFTIDPVNYNKHFDKFAYYMEANNIKKTNIIKMARADRNKAANNRYALINEFNKQKLDGDTIYIIENIGQLLSLKELFKNKNVGFFFKDNTWLIKEEKKI